MEILRDVEGVTKLSEPQNTSAVVAEGFG